MNKENAKDFLPLVQALADGKTIQENNGHPVNKTWVDCDDVDFCMFAQHYRIKPEPRKSWYRTAELKLNDMVIVATAGEFYAEDMIARNPSFIRWLTDRIYFTVTD